MKLRLSAIVLVTLFVGLLVSSCTRKYTCRCTISYSGQPGLPDTTVKEYEVRDTKKKAKAVCEENSETSELNGIKTVEECHLY